MENKWRVIAIIFIILFILETGIFIFILNLGKDSIKRENECAYNICSLPGYDSYFYDNYEQICYCYNGGEVKHQQYLK